MTEDGSYLRRQFKTVWSLTDFHLSGLGTEECLWRPASSIAWLTRAAVTWPGTADDVREWLGRLRGEWLAAVDNLSDSDLQSAQRTHWPFADRPFGDVVAWVNVELTKNAAEIGYARFLYAVRR